MKIFIVVIAVIGVVFNLRKKWYGFCFWAVSNSFWCGVNIIGGEYEQAVCYLIFVGLSFYGAWAWSRPKKEGPQLTEGDKYYVCEQFQRLSYQGSAIKDFETIGKLKKRLRAADITIEIMGKGIEQKNKIAGIAEPFCRRIMAIKDVSPGTA